MRSFDQGEKWGMRFAPTHSDYTCNNFVFQKCPQHFAFMQNPTLKMYRIRRLIINSAQLVNYYKSKHGKQGTRISKQREYHKYIPKYYSK